MDRLTFSFIFPFVLVVAIAGTIAIQHQAARANSCQAMPINGSDWDDHVGPVESIRVEDVELGLGGEPSLRKVIKFNSRGQKIEAVGYRDDGVALPKSTYSYDSMGRISKAHHYNVYGSIYLENTYTYRLDGSLKDDVQRNLEDNNILSRTVYSFDQKSGLTEVSHFDWNDKLRSRIGFVRDGQCRVTEAHGYIAYSSLKGKVILFFDGNGNVNGSVAYSSDGSIKERMKADYEFDDRGNWFKQVRSIWVVEGGKGSFEPDHATYRKFTYH